MSVKQKTISETDGFRTIVELTEIINPTGHTEIKFLTEWDNARRDGSEQVQYRLVLNSAQRQALKEFL